MDFRPFQFSRGWLWPLAIAALVFAASSRSTVAGPHVPGFDKVVHFSVYGLLATLVCRLGRGRGAAWWALVAVSAFGATDEWHQSFVPGRSMEFGDWLADTSGAALAISLYVRWERYRQWLERPIRRGQPRVENSGAAVNVGGS